MEKMIQLLLWMMGGGCIHNISATLTRLEKQIKQQFSPGKYKN